MQQTFTSAELKYKERDIKCTMEKFPNRKNKQMQYLTVQASRLQYLTVQNSTEGLQML